MRFSVLAGLVAAVAAPAALAFPAGALSDFGDISNEDLAQIQALVEQVKGDILQKRALGLDAMPNKKFDPVAQRVDTSGEHRFIPPGPNDIRGSCPGLNILANYGYINRNGVGSLTDLIFGSNKVFGMGLELATWLSTYSAVMAGDLTTVSIGGTPKKPRQGLVGGLLSSVGTGLGLFGQPQGLSHSHNRFEADVSPTRGDLYITGDVDSVNIPHFQQLWDMPQGPQGYDLTVMHPFRSKRFYHSVANNPYFFNGPYTTLAVQTATYIFTFQFFANHSAEHPDGFLDGETLKSFESVVGEPGNFKYIPGHEKIPENWYRRAIGDDFGLTGFALEAVAALRVIPDLLVLGGNTGQVNTFTGVNISDATGGVFNAANLLEGNNALCFAFLSTELATPDLLKGALGNVAKALRLLSQPLALMLETLGCPQLAKYDGSLFEQYPGANLQG